LSLDQLAINPQKALSDADYIRLHGLEFDTSNSLIPNSVMVLPRDGLTQQRQQLFNELWGQAKTMSEAI